MQHTLNFLIPNQQAQDRNECKNSLLNCGVSTGSLQQINCLVLDALVFFQRVETTCQETELSTTIDSTLPAKLAATCPVERSAGPIARLVSHETL